jgi:hypothetical protein
MAVITTAATLTTAVEDYLARDDLTTFVPNFIQNTENKLYRTLNLRNEETAMSLNVTSGNGSVPNDFKALKFAYKDGSPIQLLQWVPIEDLYRDYPVRTNSGNPIKVSREGSVFVFGPAPSDFTMKGYYYAKKPSLNTQTTSWYGTNAPEVLLYGCLMEAALFIRDLNMYQFWKPHFDEAVSTLKRENDNAETSFGALEVRSA